MSLILNRVGNKYQIFPILVTGQLLLSQKGAGMFALEICMEGLVESVEYKNSIRIREDGQDCQFAMRTGRSGSFCQGVV